MTFHKFDYSLRDSKPFAALLGLGIIAYGVWSGCELVTLQTTGLRTKGSVVRSEFDSFGGRGHWFSIVEFKAADGREVTFRDNIGRRPAINKRGEIVAVIYDPENPDHAIIDREAWNWGIPGGLVLIGGLIFEKAARSRCVPRRAGKVDASGERTGPD